MNSNNRYNISIDRDNSFELHITLKEGNTVSNLDGYTAKLDIKTSYKANTALVSYTTTNGDITIANGIVNVVLDDSKTSLNVSFDYTQLPPCNTCYYDLKLTDPDDKSQILVWGTCKINKTIT